MQENNRLELVYKNGLEVKNHIDLMAGFITESFINADLNGISFLNQCPSNISFLKYSLNSSQCWEYAIKEAFNCCINIKDLKTALKEVKKDNTIKLIIDDKNLNIIIIGALFLNYVVPLIDEEYKTSLNGGFLDKLTYTKPININTKDFNNIVKSASNIGESLLISCNGFNVDFSSNGNINQFKATIINIFELDLKCKYSIEYLNKLKGISKINEIISIFIGNDYPLMIKTDNFTFCLAPQVGE